MRNEVLHAVLQRNEISQSRNEGFFISQAEPLPLQAYLNGEEWIHITVSLKERAETKVR